MEISFELDFMVVEELRINKVIAAFASGAPSLRQPEIASGDLRSSLSLSTVAGGARGGSWVTTNGAVAVVAGEAGVFDRSRVFVADSALNGFLEPCNSSLYVHPQCLCG